MRVTSKDRAPARPILVCGCQRSGTTLLTSLLDGHSQVLVFPSETFFLESLREAPARPIEEWVERLLGSPGRRTLVDDLAPTGGAFDGGRFGETFRALAQRGGTVARLLPALIEAYGETTGRTDRRYWLEKTPGNERSLFRARQLWGELLPLYTVRDPRAVYCSWSRKLATERGAPSALSVEEFVIVWAQSLLAWERYVGCGHPGLLVRYEDLAGAPRATMQRVCGFLGIEFEESLLRPSRGETDAFWGNSSFAGAFAGVSSEPVDRWRAVLSAEVIASIELWLGQVMTRFGYEPCAPRPRAWALPAALLRDPRRRYSAGLLLALGGPGAFRRRIGLALLRPLVTEHGDLVRPWESQRANRWSWWGEGGGSRPARSDHPPG